MRIIYLKIREFVFYRVLFQRVFTMLLIACTSFEVLNYHIVHMFQVIAMVTQEMEGGKVKCHRYWPDSVSAPIVVSNR